MGYLEEKLPTSKRQESRLSRHEELLMLDSIRKRIKNYVYTLTGKFIPVEFKTKEIDGEEMESTSYTDGKRIVIGGSLQKENFPATVGLALHEGSHIVLTDFDHLKRFVDDPANVIDDDVFDVADNIGM